MSDIKFFATMDTSQYEKALEESGKKTKDWVEQNEEGGKRIDNAIIENTKTLKQQIAEQKTLIKSIERDILQLEKAYDHAAAGSRKRAAMLDLRAARKSLEEEQGGLTGLLDEQIQQNAAVAESQSGIIKGLAKWAKGVATVTVAIKVFKQVMDSTASTALVVEGAIAGIKNAMDVLWKSLARGDLDGFFRRLVDGFKAGKLAAEEMAYVSNIEREYAIKSEILRGEISERRLLMYGSDAEVSLKEKIKAGTETLALIQQQADMEIEIAEKKYDIIADLADSKNRMSKEEITFAVNNYKELAEFAETEGGKWAIDWTAALEEYDRKLGDDKPRSISVRLGEGFTFMTPEVATRIREEIEDLDQKANQYAAVWAKYESVTEGERDVIADAALNIVRANNQAAESSRMVQSLLGNLQDKQLKEAEEATKKKIELIQQEIAAKKKALAEEDILAMAGLAEDEEGNVIDGEQYQKDLFRAEEEGLKEWLAKQIELNKDNKEAQAVIMVEYAKVILAIQQKLADASAKMDKKSAKDFKDYAEQLARELDGILKGFEIDIDWGPAAEEAEQIVSLFQEIYTISEFQAMISDMDQVSGLLFDAGSALGVIDEDLGRALQDIGALTSGFTGMLVALAAGDPLAWLSAAIKIVGVLAEMLHQESEWEKEVKRQERAYERLTLSIESANKQIERQLELISELRGEPWVSGAIAEMELLDEKMKDILYSMKLIDVDIMTKNPFTGLFTVTDVNTSGWDIGKFIAMLEKDPNESLGTRAGDVFSELAYSLSGTYFELSEAQRQSLEDLMAQYEDFEEARKELLVALQEELTGTTVDSLVAQLTEGFSEGLKTAEDFASTFEDLMKAAIVNAFKRQYLEEQLKDFYALFYEKTEGGLSEDDIKILREKYNEIIAAAQEGFEGLSLALGIGVEDGTAEAIADAITTGFKEGKTSVDDFADYVNEILKDVVLGVFSKEILGDQIRQVSEYISKALEDKILTTGEKDDITAQVQAIVEANRDLWDGLTGALDFGWGSPEPLSGTISRAITEETGTELAGLMRKISDDNRANRDYNKLTVDHLVGIESNTYNTVEELKSAVAELKVISSNTTPVYTGDL